MKFLFSWRRPGDAPPSLKEPRSWAAIAALATLPALAAGVGGPERFKSLFLDPIDAPAVITARAPKIETIGVAQAGNALISVGARGAILRSENGGESWSQVASPVSVDLVSVFFVNENKGWAVGHDAVILHTQDAGRTWTRQLNGREVNQLMRASYAHLDSTAASYANSASAALQQIAPTDQSSLPLPFLDIWFANESEGYAVGAFNLLFHTVDGGKTWEPQDHLTDNPQAFHLNAMRGTPAGLVIVGERGLVLRKNESSGRFERLDTGYRGSFFGVFGNAQQLVVYGLRGNARQSHDSGRTWSEIKFNTVGNIVAVTAAESNELLFVLQDGTAMRQDATGGMHEVKVEAKRRGEIAGAALLSGNKLLTAGMQGPAISILSGATQQALVK